jgi:hypothetical protein
LHELLHLSVNSIATANSFAATEAALVVAPVASSLAVGTITSHMARVTADTTDDVRSEVALLGAVIFAMPDLTAILASLVLIVTKSTVERRQLTKLVSLEFVLAFWNRGSRLNNVVHKFLGFVNLLFSICHDQTMKILFLVASVSGVRSAFSFLDRAFASNSYLGTGLRLHLLQGVSTRTYE